MLHLQVRSISDQALSISLPSKSACKRDKTNMWRIRLVPVSRNHNLSHHIAFVTMPHDFRILATWCHWYLLVEISVHIWSAGQFNISISRDKCHIYSSFLQGTFNFRGVGAGVNCCNSFVDEFRFPQEISHLQQLVTSFSLPSISSTSTSYVVSSPRSLCFSTLSIPSRALALVGSKL